MSMLIDDIGLLSRIVSDITSHFGEFGADVAPAGDFRKADKMPTYFSFHAPAIHIERYFSAVTTSLMMISHALARHFYMRAMPKQLALMRGYWRMGRCRQTCCRSRCYSACGLCR